MLSLIKNKNCEEIYSPERCYITELLNDAQSPQLSIARCRVLPGVTTQLHSLDNCHETYLIEAGRGLMDDGENTKIPVKAGDSISIAPNHAQRIENTGEHDLEFLVICTPRFIAQCYINLEEGNDQPV